MQFTSPSSQALYEANQEARKALDEYAALNFTGVPTQAPEGSLAAVAWAKVQEANVKAKQAFDAHFTVTRV